MMEFRVLIADKARAQLYKLAGRRGSLKSLQCFINPAGQLPERALGTSRPGRVKSGAGARRYAYQPKHRVKEHAEEIFVRRVAAALAKDGRASGGAPIVLIAAPRLLGTYRQHLSAAVRDRVILEFKRDLTKLPVAELNQRVREALSAVPVSVTARFRQPRIKPRA